MADVTWQTTIPLPMTMWWRPGLGPVEVAISPEYSLHEKAQRGAKLLYYPCQTLPSPLPSSLLALGMFVCWWKSLEIIWYVMLVVARSSMCVCGMMGGGGKGGDYTTLVLFS